MPTCPGGSTPLRARFLALLALSVAAAWGFLLTGATPPAAAQGPAPEAQSTAAGRIVRVGAYNYPPLLFQDAEEEWQGVYPDILRHVASQEGWELEWHPCSWTDCLQGTADGQLDLLTAIAYSDERATLMAFSQETVLANWGQVYASPGERIETLLDLENQVVVGMAQDSHWIALQDMLERMEIPFYRIEVADYQSVFDALEIGMADAGIVSRCFGEAREHDHRVVRTPIIINPIPLRFAAPLGDPDGLLATLDERLVHLKGQTNSIYYQSLAHHMPEAVVTNVPGWLAPLSMAVIALLAGMGGAALWSSQQARHRARELDDTTEALARESGDRQQAELALQESEARYQLVFEHLSDVVCLVDTDMHILDISPSAQEVFGYSPDELVGQPVERFFPQDAWSQVLEDVQLVLAGIDKTATIYPLIASDGSIRYGEMVAAPLPQENGREALLVVIRDVTARVQAEEHLRQTQAQLVQAHKLESVALLAGGIAHDFNNMLTAIIGYLDLAMLDTPKDSQLYADVMEARHSAERATALTRQLLLFSHQQPMEMHPIDPGQTVQEILNMLERLIGEDIQIVTDLCADPPQIMGDAGQLQQVLMNLCLNARDAMPEGGTLTIRVDQVSLNKQETSQIAQARPGRFVRLSVTDTGIGMSAEVQERIFEPFYTTKPAGQGTGLGLSVSYAIVQDHKGWINVYSEPGRGTTFRVYLPALQMDEAQDDQGATSDALAPLRGHGERILLVEDDNGVRQFATAALTSHGYQVLAAENAAEALQLAEVYGGRFDLVFSDLILPDRTGLALVRELKDRWPNVAILLSSGYGTDQTHWPAILSQEILFVTKPYQLADLIASVRQALDSREDSTSGEGQG